jgi:uncharacterized sulfatase
MEGLSMVELLENPKRPWKQGAFSQYGRFGKNPVLMGRSIRTDRYRYTQWERTAHAAKSKQAYWKGPEGSVHSRELYDHQNDPGESVNLAQRDEMAPTVQALAKQLQAGWKGALPLEAR